MRRLMVVSVGLVLLLACGGDDPAGDASTGEQTSNAEPVVVQATAVDFGYMFDQESYPQGEIQISLSNEGEQPHQSVLYKLNDGVDFNDYRAAVMADQSQAPQLSVAVAEGVRKAIGPGKTDLSTPYEAEPGTYVLICWLPDQTLDTNKNHAELGMIGSFEVE